jgi:hypothetical protein
MSYNIGAILNIWALPPNKINFSFVQANFSLCDVFLMNINTNSFRIPTTFESVQAEVSFNDDDGAGLWLTEISGSIPEIHAQSKQSIDILHKPVVVILENTIHHFYLFGSREAPLYPAKFSRINPAKVSESTKYNFTLSAMHIYEPPLIRNKFGF